MNTEPNALSDLPGDSPATLSATRPLYWSVRRELWENRSLYVVPLAAAAVVLFGFSIRTLGLPHRMRELSALEPALQRSSLVLPYSVAAFLIILTTFIVGAVYCLDALHGERRDRSILFWKSLPVSDLTTVLSKASVPLVVLPLVAFGTVIATQGIMLLLSTAILLVNGIGPAALWTRLPLVQMSLVMFYGLTVHALWYAPFYGWLLLVSVWARRTTFLWAVLPPLALGVVEKIAFGTSHWASLLRYRLIGGMAEAFAAEEQQRGPIVSPMQLDPARFLSSSGLWIGLGVAAAFLALAARLRRNREPI